MDPSYNNSFGGASAFSQPATGQPVVLSSAKKKHTGAIVFVILLLCLAVAGVVAFLLIPKNGTSADIIQRYKNYIITGNENAQDTEERYNNDDIWFRDVYYDGEDSEWTTLYDKANSMLDAIGANEKMAGIVSTQKDALKTLDADRSVGRSKLSLFIDTYLKNGEYGMYSDILYKIDDFKGSNSEFSSGYYQEMDEMFESTVEYVEFFSERGCSIDEVESLDECFIDDQQNDDLSEGTDGYNRVLLWKKIVSKANEIADYISAVANNYVTSVYDLTENSNNGGENASEE